MNLRIPLLLASTLMLKMAVVLPADLGGGCTPGNDDCTTSFSTCSDGGTCVCQDNYHQDGTDCWPDCTETSCSEGEICDALDTKECIDDPGCTEGSCPNGQSCQDVGGNMVCVDDQGCTEGSCPSGKSCQDVQGSMVCVPDCDTECPEGQSCQMVDGIMQCAGAAATTASVILLTGMTMMALRFL